MKYLLIEDDQGKSEKITEHLNVLDDNAKIDIADCLSDARRSVLTNSYDLIIFDLYLPINKGEKEQDISGDIISDFAASKNSYSETIAITKFKDESLNKSPLFNDNGVTLVTFDENDNRWKDALFQKIEKIKNKNRFDFLIFCALTKERNAYQNTDAKLGSLKIIGGLSCQEITIGSYRGVCIKPQRMGLVNMAITCTKAIELFGPKIVAMSGICAGVEGESNFLDIIVGQICWEYQTGKYKDGKFQQEPYQVALKTSIATEIEMLSEDSDFLKSLKNGLYDSELKNSGINVAPISSGSAVIADATYMAIIGEQHRKWAALEMEMYSMYEAATQSLYEPLFFGAKAVVDMGDAAKGDSLHPTACTLSARFVVAFLKHYLPSICNS